MYDIIKTEEVERLKQGGKVINYAVVGIGNFAMSEVIPAFKDTKISKLVAIVSGKKDKREIIKKELNLPYAYDYPQFEECLNNPNINAIYIVLPNSMHCEYAVNSLNHKKHVLCEKPMAINSQQCSQMIDAANANAMKLMIAYRMFVEPSNIKLRDMLRSGEYGTPKVIHSTFTSDSQITGDPTQWRLDKHRAGGGSLFDVGIYCINQCRFILGEDPIEVQGKYSISEKARFKDNGIEDSISFRMGFKSGVQAMCSSGYSIGKKSFFKLGTDKCFIELEPAFSHDVPLTLKVTQNKHTVEKKYTDINQVAREIDHFSQCILENKEPDCDGLCGKKDMEIIEALYKSSDENKIIPLNFN